MVEIKKSESSRDIPLTQLYSQLQLEYLSYFLRSKIYCKDFAENYKKVCDQKKVKIEKISSPNALPSIFNNQDIKERYINEFLNPFGIPSFTYKDEAIEQKMSCWDRWYFFCKGTSVKVLIDDKIILGVVNFNDKTNNILVIEDEFKIKHTVHYNNVTRIFPEGFWNF